MNKSESGVDMAKKKISKNIPLPILIIIYAVLLHAIYLSLSTLALAIWGESVMGTVDSYVNRLEDTKAEPNRSRIVSKGYWFMAKGKEYRGYVIYSSDEAWSRLEEGETRSERIRYLDFFPYINKPSTLSEFDEMGEVAIIYHIFALFGYLLLLLLVSRTGRGKKKKKAEAKKPATPKKIEIRSDRDMFCNNCGNKLLECAEFCIGCGTAVNQVAPEPADLSQAASSMSPQGGARLVGFSDRYNSPEILAAAQKNKKYSIGYMWILVSLPLIGFPAAGFLMDDFSFGESLIMGGGIALVMLVLNLLALRKTKQPMWEGVVVNMYSKEEYVHRDRPETYTEYTTVIRRDTGKIKKIMERDSRRLMYDYLSVGDRVRFHPKFGTYEKYDKSKDQIIYCNICTTMNPIQNDRCKRCNNLLFK